jgi:hypothetical protein
LYSGWRFIEKFLKGINMAKCSCGCGQKVRFGRSYLNQRSKELGAIARLGFEVGKRLGQNSDDQEGIGQHPLRNSLNGGAAICLHDSCILHNFSTGKVAGEKMPSRVAAWENERLLIANVSIGIAEGRLGRIRSESDLSGFIAALSKSQKKKLEAGLKVAMAESRTRTAETHDNQFVSADTGTTIPGAQQADTSGLTTPPLNTSTGLQRLCLCGCGEEVLGDRVREEFLAYDFRKLVELMNQVDATWDEAGFDRDFSTDLIRDTKIFQEIAERCHRYTVDEGFQVERSSLYTDDFSEEEEPVLNALGTMLFTLVHAGLFAADEVSAYFVRLGRRGEFLRESMRQARLFLIRLYPDAETRTVVPGVTDRLPHDVEEGLFHYLLAPENQAKSLDEMFSGFKSELPRRPGTL